MNQSYGNRPDIRQDLLSDEEFENNCFHYADWAFYTPPEEFLFHHYDESPDNVLICHRPMIGIEKYVVNGLNGGFYGTYDTRDVTKYLKNGTWIEVPSKKYFAELKVKNLEYDLEKAKKELEKIV